MHSNIVSPELLDGRPAEIFVQAVRSRLAQGVRRFCVLPLFFGPSRALTEFLPELFTELSADYPEARMRIADPLGGGDVSCPDPRLAQALAERVHALEQATGGDGASLIMVDHGSPVAEVAALRNAVALQLAALLGRMVLPASMERRPELEYDFNEPLLEAVLRRQVPGPVTVAQLFLLEGRHAGPAGDIAKICAKAESKRPGLSCSRTELLGEHPLIADILSDRLKSIQADE